MSNKLARLCDAEDSAFEAADRQLLVDAAASLRTAAAAQEAAAALQGAPKGGPKGGPMEVRREANISPGIYGAVMTQHPLQDENSMSNKLARLCDAEDSAFEGTDRQLLVDAAASLRTAAAAQSSSVRAIALSSSQSTCTRSRKSTMLQAGLIEHAVAGSVAEHIRGCSLG